MSKQRDLAGVARDAGTGYVNLAGDTMTGNLVTTHEQFTVARADGSMARLSLGNSNRLWTVSNYGTQYSPNGQFAIADESAAVVRMAINTAGHVTMPYQPLVSLHQTRTEGGPTANRKMVWFNPFLNVGGHWDNSNQRFVCPVTGFYQVVMQGIKYPQSGALHVDLYINGVNNSVCRARAEEAAGYNQYSTSNVVSAAAGDVLEFYHFGDGGIHDSHGLFSIRLIG